MKTLVEAMVQAAKNCLPKHKAVEVLRELLDLQIDSMCAEDQNTIVKAINELSEEQE